MMKFCSLTSGSSGNCLFVSDENTKILIDCGVSAKKASLLLEEIGENMSDISAILITHEHSDHISGVSVSGRKYNIPIYITKKTYEQVPFNVPQIRFIETSSFSIGTLEINTFKTSHDAADSIGYIITSEKSRCLILTDTGVVTREIYNNFKNINFAYIESNHDVEMLIANPKYTYPLKMRILSEKGHLSNKMCADVVCKLVSDGVKHIMLGHLSNENNSPEIAYETTKASLDILGLSENITLNVSTRNSPSEIIKF